MSIEIGAVLDGTVVSITGFGAFVSLPEGKTGMVHISEVADAYVRNISDHLAVNDAVKVKVLAIDPNGKISLSIRKAQPTAPRISRPAEMEYDRRRDDSGSFEDRISKFIKDSEERLLDVKRNREHKRGGRAR